MFGINNFYCVTLHKDELKVSITILSHGILPIIWMNNGLYGLITREKIKNTIQHLENDRKLRPMNPYPVAWTFHWDETLLLPPAIGEQLFGK